MFFTKFFTAVEIDYDHFKILEVIKKGRGYLLNNFINAKLPSLNHPDISGGAINLNKLMNDNKISKNNVFANINDNAVHSYNFYLPDMPRNDLNKAVEYEVKKLIPFPISSCIFDYISVKNGSTLNITAFVSKTDDINNFKEIFIRAGIKLKSIECKTASIYNNIVFLGNNKVDHLLLCDIGEKAAKIVIIRDKAVNFERTIEGIDLKDLNDDESSLLIGNELKKTVDFYFAGKFIAPIDGIIITGIYSGNEGFNGKIKDMMHLKTYSISIVSLLKERKIFLSKRLVKYNINENYDFFKPLEEMWTTFGLIVNR
ncbi:MAG: pilus assembly protein PilM [Deltaproteobacteria bacterium]|nr:pilus assembly protein PilM [Deltaproteobacteria bacterium]